MNTSISSSFRRHVRGGVESQQLDQLSLLLDTVILSNMDDRWFWDLNGDGVFQVKDVRFMLDEAFLPKMEVPTRWIKSIPIKVNVFAWKLYLDRLPTRSNLSHRNVSLPYLACPLCDHVLDDSSYLFFGCSVTKDIQKLICRWWNLDVHPYESYEDWLSWFKSIRLGSKTKEVLEGVFYVSWWSLWNFRNQFLFASPIPRKDAIFDNIVLRSFYWCVARCNRTLNWNSFDALMEKDTIFLVNNETWKASYDVGSIMDDSDSEEVENVFVKDNGNSWMAWLMMHEKRVDIEEVEHENAYRKRVDDFSMVIGISYESIYFCFIGCVAFA
ncbi:RNA-directed DNA polymerase, eukaryota [Tanacetum coccineum]